MTPDEFASSGLKETGVNGQGRPVNGELTK